MDLLNDDISIVHRCRFVLIDEYNLMSFKEHYGSKKLKYPTNAAIDLIKSLYAKDQDDPNSFQTRHKWYKLHSYGGIEFY